MSNNLSRHRSENPEQCGCATNSAPNMIIELEQPSTSAAPFTDTLASHFLRHVADYDANTVMAQSGLSARLKKQLAECILAAELKHHLFTQAEQNIAQSGNYRNGSTPKTVFTPSGELELDIPRVRFATFEPCLIPRYQRHLRGFDDNVLALYARGMGVDEMQARLLSLYDTQICRELAATVTNEVLIHTRQWQARALEKAYSVVYFDALQLQIQAADEGKKTPVHLALGMRPDGYRDVLGFWREKADFAFWRKVMQELRSRGLTEMEMITSREPQGLHEAVASAYPAANLSATSNG